MSVLFQEYVFNNGVKARNRLVVAPMTHWSSDAQGHATQTELDFIRPRAENFGIFIAAATAINPQARAFVGEPNACADSDIEHLKKIADTIKAQGTLAILQLHHGGKESIAAETEGKDIIAPSADAAKNAREMSLAEIRETVADFASAAKRAQAAGFDGVEIHGANNYLLQQFLSAHHNRRTDEYGGSLEKRMRFPLEVLAAVQEACRDHPEFIIGYRLTPEEPHTHGLTMADASALVDALKSRNLQYIHISLQDFYSKARRGADTHRSRLDLFSDRLKDSGIALIGVGKLSDPKKAEAAMQTGWVDFVAIGMGVLANPDFALRAQSGDFSGMRKMLDLSRDAAFHQMPDAMWQAITSKFIPKPVMFVFRTLGKIRQRLTK